METQIMIVLVLAVVVAVTVGLWIYIKKRETKTLRAHFGPEYDHTVQRLGSQARAEADLKAREKRIEQLNIVPLPPAEGARFTQAWRSLQTRFVDNPKGAVAEADRLVTELMQKRGYPIADFDQRAADISVDHPNVVDNYRAARDIALRNERGGADTEELRKALVYYRALFEDLLEIRESERVEVRG